jgi:hypothetical protein
MHKLIQVVITTILLTTVVRGESLSDKTVKSDRIYFVSNDYVGLQSPYFRNIKSAIFAADSGYTIYVSIGAYNEIDTISGKKYLSIIGSGQTDYRGGRLSGGTIVNGFRIDNSSFISIGNFGIDGIGSSVQCVSKIGGCSDISLSNLTIKNGTNQHAIVIEELNFPIQNTSVSNAKIFGGTHGVIIKSSKSKITNCVVDSVSGLGFAFVSDNINNPANISRCFDVEVAGCAVTRSAGSAFNVYSQDHSSETNAAGVPGVNNVRFTNCSAENCLIGFNTAIGSSEIFPKTSTGKSQEQPHNISYFNCSAIGNKIANWYINRGQKISLVSCTAYGAAYGYLNQYPTNDVSLTNSLPADNEVLLNTIANIYGFSTTSVLRNSAPPKEFVLYENYPNPFNPSTTVKFSLSEPGFVALKIFDHLGRVVSTLVEENLPAGVHSRKWEPIGMASGIYYYRLFAGKFMNVKKMVLAK